MRAGVITRESMVGLRLATCGWRPDHVPTRLPAALVLLLSSVFCLLDSGFWILPSYFVIR